MTLFFFGLVNAGVPPRAFGPGTWDLPIAVIPGRPIGLAASVGFSPGLLVSSALLPAGQLRAELSMGVLLTLLTGPLAFAVAKILRAGRFAVLSSAL